MRIRATSLLGPLVGLALAALLLLPSVDRTALRAQGLSRLLQQDWEGAFRFGEDGSMVGVGAIERSFFHALTHLAVASPQPIVLSAMIRVEGEEATDPAFARGLGTSLNLLNAARGNIGLPPIELGSPEAGGTLAAVIDLSDDGQAVRFSSRIVSAQAGADVVPLGEDGSQTAWAVPGRSSLLPPLIAILVALLFRRVLVALFLGILTGAVLLAYGADPVAGVITALGRGTWDVFGTYLHHELVDTFRIEIIGFVVALVAMVGVMSRGGGIQGLVETLLRFARTVRSTMAVTWGMGLLIFFDDYANCLLVGNTMRPLTDRLRISREKLAYIVDSTAAPIAGVSLLSTWIAFEVSTYSAQLPGVGISDSAYAIFLQTLPYRFYCIFTLIFVGLVIFTRRDFGPMLAAELRARTTGQLVREGGTPLVSSEATRIERRQDMPLRWERAALPIALVLFGTMARIFVDGGGWTVFQEHPERLLTFEGLTAVLYGGSGASPIFIGALVGWVLAVWMVGSNVLRWSALAGLALAALTHGWVAEALAPHVGADAIGYIAWLLPGLAGAGLVAVGLQAGGLHPTRRPHLAGAEISRASLSSIRALFFAVLILLQAWMIGAVCADIKTADYLVALTSGAVSPTLLPALLFLVSALVALATGSSWSTMSILLPNVVALASAVGADHVVGSIGMVVLCIGSVLEGSILGDHCSPISDTTVLSSVSSASDHIDHVRTQMPYALFCGALAIGAGYLPTLLWPAWSFGAALACGLAVMLGALFLVGRRTPEAATA